MLALYADRGSPYNYTVYYLKITRLLTVALEVILILKCLILRLLLKPGLVISLSLSDIIVISIASIAYSNYY